MEYSKIFSFGLNVGLFCGKLSVLHNIVMDLNNVMMEKNVDLDLCWHSAQSILFLLLM